jgi:5-methylcytosine-specific restriction endonuclease McrA
MVSDRTFAEAVASSSSIKATLRYLQLSPSGAAFQSARLRVGRLRLDTSHFRNVGQAQNNRRQNPEQVLVIREPGTRTTTLMLRRAMLETGVKHLCAICRLPNVWRGSEIVLEIDHIDGKGHNNVISNLRFLCPNCHSQTKTFGNRARSARCIDCSIPVTRGSTRCIQCAVAASTNRTFASKIEWPDDEILIRMISTTSGTVVAAALGVSGAAIGKRIRKRRIATSIPKLKAEFRLKERSLVG